MASRTWPLDTKALNSSHDSDGDGIPDAVEQAGFLDAAGDVVKTDPNDPDYLAKLISQMEGR